MFQKARTLNQQNEKVLVQIDTPVIADTHYRFDWPAFCRGIAVFRRIIESTRRVLAKRKTRSNTTKLPTTHKIENKSVSCSVIWLQGNQWDIIL